ncbi:MAG: SusC/RagA family TonB-linked outer membrane protein, partial [Bacteroidota bacterium]
TVESIFEGVDEVPIAGYTNLGNFAVPGEWYGIMKGIPFERNEDGVLLIDEEGNYIPDQEIGVIGNPNPMFQTNLNSNMSFAGFNLRAQLSYTHRGDIYSITTATMLARGNTVDTDFDRFLPIIQPGIRQTTESENDIQGYVGDLFFRSYFFADEGAVFDGTNLRLREISLSYTLPKAWLEKLPIGSLSLALVGENLWFEAFNFPAGVNFDPEVLSLGVGNGRGFDLLTGPTAKRYGGNISLTF